MGVHVERDRHGGVPKSLADNLWVNATGQHEARVCVAQVVKSDLEPSPPAHTLERVRYGLRRERRAVQAGEYKLRAREIGAEPLLQDAVQVLDGASGAPMPLSSAESPVPTRRVWSESLILGVWSCWHTSYPALCTGGGVNARW